MSSSSNRTWPEVDADVNAVIEREAANWPQPLYQACFFLARGFKSIPELTGWDPERLRPAVEHWMKVTGEESDIDEVMEEFVTGWEKVRHLEGDDQMAALFEAALKDDVPEEALKFDTNVRRLAQVCRALQRFWGDQPFYLATRRGAEVVLGKEQAENGDQVRANRWFRRLLRSKLLVVVEEGRRQQRRATRFRYLGQL